MSEGTISEIWEASVMSCGAWDGNRSSIGYKEAPFSRWLDSVYIFCMKDTKSQGCTGRLLTTVSVAQMVEWLLNRRLVSQSLQLTCRNVLEQATPDFSWCCATCEWCRSWGPVAQCVCVNVKIIDCNGLCTVDAARSCSSSCIWVSSECSGVPGEPPVQQDTPQLCTSHFMYLFIWKGQNIWKNNDRT